jgi:hypothetical protein
LNSLKDGDRVVCATRGDADHLLLKCRELDLQVEVVLLKPQSVHEVPQFPPSKGRTLFDHGWVEQYYMRAIEQARMDIDLFQQLGATSGTEERLPPYVDLQRSKWRGY